MYETGYAAVPLKPACTARGKGYNNYHWRYNKAFALRTKQITLFLFIFPGKRVRDNVLIIF